MIIKKLLTVAIFCLLLPAVSPAQESTGNSDLLRHATFSIETGNAVFTFVLLTDKTVDALFSGPSKYSIRARANQSTTFYVQAKITKTHNFKPSFEIVQNSLSIPTQIISIKNFKDGSVEKGDKVEGLMKLVQNLNLYQPFSVKDSDKKYPEFQYGFDAIEAIKN